MPTFEHEGLVELFRDRQLLAVELAEAVGIKLPDWQQVASEPAEVPDLVATRYADAVIKLTDDSDRAVFAFVVEVQLGRDDGKEWTWPRYLAEVRERLRCPVALLVICLERTIASWAASPIELGPGSGMTPMVVGPTEVPVVADRADARRSPQLAILSGIAHGADPARRRVLDAVVAACDAAGAERSALYHDLIAVSLPVAALEYLEAQMPLVTEEEYRRELAHRHFSRGKAEGEARGEAKALLRVLAARGVEVPDGARARITGCTDLEQLEAWLGRAVTATSIDDLFV